MTTPECSTCLGACCEYMILPVFDDGDASRWLRLHGEGDGSTVILDVECKELNSKGQCGIYTSRPQLCRDFEVGSKECLDAIRRRRPEYWAELL